MKAKYLFSTHGAFSWSNPNKQVFVCLWHGTPLKKIGRLQNPDSNTHFLQNCKIILSPSESYSSIIAQCFGKDIKSVLISGYPRNDFLFQRTNCLEKLGINIGLDKLVLYLPTFRKPIGGGYVDSNQNVFESGVINFSNPDDISEWNSYLKELGVKLIVKPHPSDASIPNDMKLSNIIIDPHAELTKNDIQLYNILFFADALITDFSSVFCDFLMLDRPIGFVLSDINEYQSNRGFVFDNIDDKLPGVKITTKKNLKTFLDQISKSEDICKDIRHKLMPLYINNISSNNSEELWKIVETFKSGLNFEKSHYIRNI